jgi:hypothetical protein
MHWKIQVHNADLEATNFFKWRLLTHQQNRLLVKHSTGGQSVAKIEPLIPFLIFLDGLTMQ